MKFKKTPEITKTLDWAALQTHREDLIGLRNNRRGAADAVFKRLQQGGYVLPDTDQPGILLGQVMLVPSQKRRPSLEEIPPVPGAKVRVQMEHPPTTLHLSYEIAGQYINTLSMFPGYGRLGKVENYVSVYFPYSYQYLPESPLYVFNREEEVAAENPLALTILNGLARAVSLANGRLLPDAVIPIGTED